MDDLSSTLTALFAHLQSSARSSVQLPPSDTLNVLTLTSSPLQTHLETTSHQLIKLISIINRHFVFEDSDGTKDERDEEKTLEERFNELKELNDIIIDLANRRIDVMEGWGEEANDNDVGKAKGAKVFVDPLSNVMTGMRLPREKRELSREALSQRVEKPQKLFKDKPDNSEAPFVPKLIATGKDECTELEPIREDENADMHLAALYSQNPSISTRHPFEAQISKACENVCAKVFDADETQLFLPLEKTKLTFVHTREQLSDVCDRLLSCMEIGLDVEHHSYRSYLGFVCLIQISTRSEDFIIDALALRSEIPELLRPILQNMSIVKVLHGAKHDIQWLERCFSLYVFPLFDTGIAAALLGFPSRSLAYLLARFANVQCPDKKKFQLADWRIRPVPKSMIEYARSDTHYLLYMYDRLRTELSLRDRKGSRETQRAQAPSKSTVTSPKEKGPMLKEAWRQSAKVARQRFTKPRAPSTGMGQRVACKYNLKWGDEDIAVADTLCKWRDAEARRRDESWAYIMSNRSLINLVAGRKASGKVVAQEAGTIQKIIEEARKEVQGKKIRVASRKPVKERGHIVFSEESSNAALDFGLDSSDGVDIDAKYGIQQPIKQTEPKVKARSSLITWTSSSPEDDDEDVDEDSVENSHRAAKECLKGREEEDIEEVKDVKQQRSDAGPYRQMINRKTIRSTTSVVNDFSSVTDRDGESHLHRNALFRDETGKSTTQNGRDHQEQAHGTFEDTVPQKRLPISMAAFTSSVKMARLSSMLSFSSSDDNEEDHEDDGNDLDVRGKHIATDVLKCIKNEALTPRITPGEDSNKSISNKDEATGKSNAEKNEKVQLSEPKSGHENRKNKEDTAEGELLSLNERYNVVKASKNSRKKKKRKGKRCTAMSGFDQSSIFSYDYAVSPYVPTATQEHVKKPTFWFNPYNNKGVLGGEEKVRGRRAEISEKRGLSGNRSMTYSISERDKTDASGK